MLVAPKESVRGAKLTLVCSSFTQMWSILTTLAHIHPLPVDLQKI